MGGTGAQRAIRLIPVGVLVAVVCAIAVLRGADRSEAVAPVMAAVPEKVPARVDAVAAPVKPSSTVDTVEVGVVPAVSGAPKGVTQPEMPAESPIKTLTEEQLAGVPAISNLLGLTDTDLAALSADELRGMANNIGLRVRESAQTMAQVRKDMFLARSQALSANNDVKTLQAQIDAIHAQITAVLDGVPEVVAMRERQAQLQQDLLKLGKTRIAVLQKLEEASPGSSAEADKEQP